MIDKKFSRYERITNTPDLLSEIKRKSKDKDAVERVKTKAIIGDGPTKFDPDGFNKKLDDHNFDFGPVEEAIIEVFGRPVLEIENDNINTDEPELDFWKSILDDNNDGFHEVIKSVGRIEVNGHPNLDWVGTGWLYKDDYIITNRHVAKEFARKRGSEFVFKKTFWGDQYECKIDFKEEIGSSKSVEYALHKVVYIAPENGPDVAVLKIKWTDNNSKFASLILADEIIKDETIAIIGYPARDSRTNIPEDQLRIFSNVFNKKRLAVGEIDYIDKHLQFFVHDCTTLGGNSGSPVIDIESKKVYGLHFSGREREGNFAVTSVLLEQLLNDVTKKTMVSTGTTISEDFADLEKRISKEDLKDRNGYNKDFLNKTIPFPELSDTLQDEVATFGENHDETELKYTNYSVIMSAKKKLSLVTAVNIDGNKWRHVVRGSDSWKKDPRLNRKFQVGNELYVHNKFDRGHLVRRLDPAWGDSFKDAKFASDDTFFYTNCAPQHKNLNQDIWLDLEEFILSNAKGRGMKVTVFNGPIFSDNDMFYRDIQIPESFWKVVITNTGNNEIHATGYMLSQKQWLDDIEFVFGAYRTYQIPISMIEEQTGFTFSKDVQESDPLFSDLESVFGSFSIHPLDSVNKIKF